jgi:hypothetical protein
MNAPVIAFDKLAYLDRLRSAGVTDEVARPHAEGLDHALRESVATKTDIDRLDAKIDKLDAKIDATAAAVHAEIDRLDTKIDTTSAAIRADIDKLEIKLDGRIATVAASLSGDIQKSQNALLIWLIALILGSTATIGGIVYSALKSAGKTP